MALIGMAVYSTDENEKDDCLKKTLDSLQRTVNFDQHRLMLSVNAFTRDTKDIVRSFDEIITGVIYNEENIGTANAINKVWKQRNPGEHVVKMDDDIVVNEYSGWLDEMEEAVSRDLMIGQIGLKRKDCIESIYHPDPDYRSTLIQLPHQPGERWITVERSKHIIGSCVLHSSSLIDKVGALYQPSLYGYDDVIMSHRSYIAGFYSCFLSHVPIDHIDDGRTPYQTWKHRHSGEQTQNVINLVQAMLRGEKPVYYQF